MRSSRRRTAQFAAAMALLLLCPSGDAVAKKKGPYTVVPAVSGTKITAGTEVVEIKRGGLTAEVSYVAGSARRRMMQATLGIDGDPFASPSGDEVRFHTFLVYFRNDSTSPLMFNPSVSRIRTNRELHAYALDYTYLFQVLGQGEKLSMDDVHKIAFDQSITLNPGEKAKKLLVFQSIPGTWKEFILLLSLEKNGVKAVDLSIPFRKVYLEEGD